MTTSISKSVIKRKPKIIINKQFKLVDFHIYEDVPKKEEPETSDFTEQTSYKNDSIFTIQMFGINEQGETCAISINDYQPFFYVKVADNWDNKNVADLLGYIRKSIGSYYESSILQAVLVEHNKLYGFSANKTHKFVKFVFQNTTTMNRVKSLWFTPYSPTVPRKPRKFWFPPNNAVGSVLLELYESNIPPLLRYFHINSISPSGWVSIPISRAIIPNIKTTTCTYEYISSASNIKPVLEKETLVPYKICSFDIEASSSHGDFPLPKKNYKRLAINIIDVFTLHAKTQIINYEMAKQLFSKQILTAFGYSKFENIDSVYPKIKPSKQKVLELITEILTHSFQTIQTSSSKEKTELLTIDSIFEKNNESVNSYADGGDCDEDGDADETGNDGGDAEEMVEYPSVSKRFTKSVKPKTSETIIDILLSTSYDREYKIQCMNEGLTLVFPQLEGDKTTFIGSSFLRYGETTPYLNHCLVLGSCDKIEGVAVESVNTEKELLVKWTELIQRENPDIIIGYNIFGFDYEFMFQRALETQCEYEFLTLSRRVNDLCAKQSKDGNLSIESSKIQLSTGEYDLRFFKMCGRLQIDLYAYFRRDFNLSSYKLDDVAGQFIGDSIKKIVHCENENITELYSQNLMGLNVGDFIHIELSSFTTDYYKNGKKFKVVNIVKDRSVIETVKGKDTVQMYNIIIIEGQECTDIDISKSIRWGMAKDDVSPQDIFRLTNGTSADRAIVAKYCIQDCNLVHHLMNKIDILTGYVEMSRICSVPISFLVFRGQGIKLTSYVAKKCREKNTLMPDLERIEYADGYEGAIVLPPKCSMYMDNPVACVDYSSLYPSSMISQNLSHDSKVWTKEYNLQGKLICETGETDKFGNYKYDNMEGYSYIDLEFDTFKYIRNPLKPTAKAEKTKSGKIVCRWAQFPNNRKGIMPSILEELLKARSDTRKMIKTETDPFIQNILDKRQLGYKVTANSLYGQCGSRTSTFYEKDVAASTTATGRMMIIYAKRIIEEVYSNMIYETTIYGNVKCNAEYIYGDTDSVFFTFNLENPETGEKIRGKPALEITIEIAQDAANLCTQYLKPPMELSYEKTLMPFILLSKKRYVGMLYENDANKGKLKYMGLSLKRRDSCDYLKDTYGGVLNILMKENSIKPAIQFLENSLDNLIAGNVPMDKLSITKALRSDYKNPNQIAHKVLADRIGQRDPGNKPKSGDRLKFIHISHPNNKALQGEKIETPEYIIANRVLIDYSFYITNQIMKPLQQLFGLAVEQIWKYKNKENAIKKFTIDMNKLNKECGYDLEVFMKKKEKYCSDVIKVLIFDAFLVKIKNAKNKQQPITNMFKPATFK